MNATRPAVGQAEQRIERPNEAPVSGHVDRHHVVPCLRIKLMQGRQQAQNAGIADKDVKPAPTAIERFAQPVDGGEVAQIHGNQGRRLRLFRPERSNFVVEFLEAALGAGQRHDMRARLGQGEQPPRGQCRERPRSPARSGAVHRASRHSIDTPCIIC